MAKQASSTSKKPNILILWGDDIGTWNISYFSRGMMGYRTPNIDRVAEEGVAFTDYMFMQDYRLSDCHLSARAVRISTKRRAA